MKILFINEFVKRRGAEEIVADLMNGLSLNNDVKCLCFSLGDAKTMPKGYSVITTLKASKLFFDVVFYLKIRSFIKDYNPDIIILHNVFSSPITVYHAIKDYKGIQVIHDYKIVCPLGNCVYANQTHDICKGYNSGHCFKDCVKNHRIKRKLQLYLLKKCCKLRKKYISYLVSPSERLNKYLQDYGYNSVCINNPFKVNNNNLKNNCKIQKNKFIYVGEVSEEKGIFNFCDFIIKNNLNIILDIYGHISDESKNEVKMINDKTTKITFMGSIERQKLLEKYSEYKFLIVPSICMDNYPTVILEAMGNGIVVIGTDRGGIPEMLEKGRGFYYEYGNVDEQIEMISKVINIDNDKYEIIRENAFNYVKKNNNVDNYVIEFLKLINIVVSN